MSFKFSNVFELGTAFLTITPMKNDIAPAVKNGKIELNS